MALFGRHTRGNICSGEHHPDAAPRCHTDDDGSDFRTDHHGTSDRSLRPVQTAETADRQTPHHCRFNDHPRYCRASDVLMEQTP